MAHAFIKPKTVVDTAVKLLQREIVLPNLVWLNGLGDFAGRYEDTINIRVPAATTANTRVLRGTGAARNLTASDLTEDSIPVKLTDDVYNLVLLTDEEKTLDIYDFTGQVLNRQVRAVAERLEDGVADLMVNAPYALPVTEFDDETVFQALTHGRRLLNDKYVPRDGRTLVVGSAIEEAILASDKFSRYDSAGDSNTSALRDARLGKIAGMDVIVADRIPHGDAYIFHKTAFVMASRPPSPPQSGGDRFSAVAAEGGLALRWLGDYDPTITSDRSLVDTFVGYSTISDPNQGFIRAVRLHLTATSLAPIAGNGTVTAAAGPNKTRQLRAFDNNGDDVTEKAAWSSSDATKATVSNTPGSKGLVTGVAAGTATITANYGSGELTKTATVTVS